ncbi:MAG: hypothetical protein JXR94_05335 [Candidatus Hydrogenedentes bacterium]|nr:hypothetical protein [Candidatus Hydrogenedentota bacterium]
MPRLEFENRLIARITEPRAGTRRRLSMAWLGGLALVALILAGALSARATLFALDKAGLARTAIALLDALRAEEPGAALAAFAEGPGAGDLLREEEQRVFLPGVAPGDHARSPEERRAQIAAVRAELTEQGVRWDDVSPLAFGGVRARIWDPALMQEPAEIAMGNVYFTSGGRVFAVEVSAWRCGSDYVIVDIWQRGALDITEAGVKDHAGQCFERFQDEPTPSPDGASRITRARRVFSRL